MRLVVIVSAGDLRWFFLALWRCAVSRAAITVREIGFFQLLDRPIIMVAEKVILLLVTARNRPD